MLVGFFKEIAAKDCDVQVTGFCDRIWVNPDLSATVLRVFSLSVAPASAAPLRRVLMLVGPPLKSFQSLNDTAYDGTLYWNSTDLRTTATYEVLKTPSPTVKADRGRINDDLIELDVFQDKDVKVGSLSIGTSTLLKLEFPDDLKKGEKAQFRLQFQIPDFFKVKDPNAPRAEHFCELRYFNARGPQARDAVQILGGDSCWIPVLARPASPSDGTGFTIVLYALPGFAVGDGFGLSSQAFDQYTPDGSQSVTRVKLIWQLDELLERDQADPNQPVSTASYVRLSGSLIQSDDGKPIRDLQQSVGAAEKGLDAAQGRIKDLKKEVRWATIIAIVGTIFAIAALLIDVLRHESHSVPAPAPSASQN